jgi:hypothetical protein
VLDEETDVGGCHGRGGGSSNWRLQGALPGVPEKEYKWG